MMGHPESDVMFRPSIQQQQQMHPQLIRCNSNNTNNNKAK